LWPASSLLSSVTLAMAQIVGSTPNRRPTQLPSCGGLRTGRFAADDRPADRWHLAGRPTRCDQRSCHQRWLFLRTCPARRLPAPGPGHEPWTGPPSLGVVARPGMTGLLGTGPRAMPLRAAPGGSSGSRRLQPEPSATRNGATDARCGPCGAPAGCATHGPARASQPKALATPGGPSGSSESDCTAAVFGFWMVRGEGNGTTEGEVCGGWVGAEVLVGAEVALVVGRCAGRGQR
jgi:hypothetical protein